MIPESYWQSFETPSRNSPIGRIMRQLDFLYPGTPMDQLRAMAHARNHTKMPQHVKWSKEESLKLRGYSDPGVSGGEGRLF